MSAEVHIASLLVHARPESVSLVRDRIAGMAGVELHAEQAGKMVITLEGPHEGWVADRMNAINRVEGVLSAVLVFHQVDTDAETPQEREPREEQAC